MITVVDKVTNDSGRVSKSDGSLVRHDRAPIAPGGLIQCAQVARTVDRESLNQKSRGQTMGRR
jgi:hypothetical protein